MNGGFSDRHELRSPTTSRGCFGWITAYDFSTLEPGEMKARLGHHCFAAAQKLTCAAAVAMAAGCGGGDGQGGGSSSGGGSTVLGAVVIGVAVWLGKSLLERAGQSEQVAGAALSSLSLQFAHVNSVKTSGNLGYVALSSAPALRERNGAFCREFVRAALAGSNRTAADAQASQQINVTVWSVKDEGARSIDKTDCAELISRHDYEHSASLLVGSQLESAQGPVLVSYLRTDRGPNPSDIRKRPALVWDLSPIASADYGLVLKAWAMLQALSSEEVKRAFAEPSFADTVDRIAGISASRAYAKDEIRLSLREHAE